MSYFICYMCYYRQEDKETKIENEDPQPEAPQRTLNEYREQEVTAKFEFEFNIRQVDKETSNSRWKGAKAITREEENYISPHYVSTGYSLVNSTSRRIFGRFPNGVCGVWRKFAFSED